jgi:hypothetical protein
MLLVQAAHEGTKVGQSIKAVHGVASRRGVTAVCNVGELGITARFDPMIDDRK